MSFSHLKSVNRLKSFNRLESFNHSRSFNLLIIVERCTELNTEQLPYKSNQQWTEVNIGWQTVDLF